MDNKEVYTTKLDESGETRKILNEVHHATMKTLQKKFEAVTGHSPKLFALAKDMLYYTGGYPKDTSRAKLDVMIDKIAQISKILTFLKEDAILNEYCRRYGIEIKVTSPLEDKETDYEGKQQFTSTAAEQMMGDAMTTQGTICKLADTIKIDAAEEVTRKCGILGPHFVSAVNLKYKQMKGRPIDDELAKADLVMLSNKEAMSVFKK